MKMKTQHTKTYRMQQKYSKREVSATMLTLKKISASLVAQWLRICLPMQWHGFEPWSGKIPHATEQLSLSATTTEPALYSLQATTTEPACHNY